MKKQFILSLLLMLITTSMCEKERFIFTDQVEDLDSEAETDFFVDFDTLLSLEYDPDNPKEFKPPQKNPIEYVPPIIRTIGFVLFTSYIELHNAVKKRFKKVKKYLVSKLYHKSEESTPLKLDNE